MLPSMIVQAEREKAEKQVRARRMAAVNTLERLGYTYHGGELWEPPLGPVPDFSADIEPAPAPRDDTPWRDAVTDALVVSHIYQAEHDSDPRKALNDLLCWEREIALDPAVSEEARSPARLANTFWSLDSNEQVEFFEALAAEIDKTNRESPRSIGTDGEMQWHVLAQAMGVNDRPRAVLMAMAAPLFLYTLREAKAELREAMRIAEMV